MYYGGPEQHVFFLRALGGTFLGYGFLRFVLVILFGPNSYGPLRVPTFFWFLLDQSQCLKEVDTVGRILWGGPHDHAILRSDVSGHLSEKSTLRNRPVGSRFLKSCEPLFSVHHRIRLLEITRKIGISQVKKTLVFPRFTGVVWHFL